MRRSFVDDRNVTRQPAVPASARGKGAPLTGLRRFCIET
jgi:hypothetical protein